MLARATRDRIVDGDVVIGPNREAAEESREDASAHTAVVLASGGLGLISLPERGHRLSVEEIESLHPRLLDTLKSHPGIGFVMVRADEGGAVVLGPNGSRRLRDDRVTGQDPLRDFGRGRASAAPTGSSTVPTSSSTVSTTPMPTRSRPSRSSWARTEASAAGRAIRSRSCRPPGVRRSSRSSGRGRCTTIRSWLRQTGLELKPHHSA